MVLAGVTPTRGADVTDPPPGRPPPRLQSVGPICRHAEDLALVLEAITANGGKRGRRAVEEVPSFAVDEVQFATETLFPSVPKVPHMPMASHGSY